MTDIRIYVTRRYGEREIEEFGGALQDWIMAIYESLPCDQSAKVVDYLKKKVRT